MREGIDASRFHIGVCAFVACCVEQWIRISALPPAGILKVRVRIDSGVENVNVMRIVEQIVDKWIRAVCCDAYPGKLKVLDRLSSRVETPAGYLVRVRSG